jgi:hypothetical protein
MSYYRPRRQRSRSPRADHMLMYALYVALATIVSMGIRAALG